MWSAVHARWLIQCEALSGAPPDLHTAVLQRLYAILLSWKSLPQSTIPPEVIATTCDCLKDILKLVDLAAGFTSRFILVPLTPPPH